MHIQAQPNNQWLRCSVRGAAQWLFNRWLQTCSSPIKLKRSRLRCVELTLLAIDGECNQRAIIDCRCFGMLSMPSLSKLATMHNLQAEHTSDKSTDAGEIISARATLQPYSIHDPALFLPCFLVECLISFYLISPPLTKQFGSVFIIHSFR